MSIKALQKIVDIESISKIYLLNNFYTKDNLSNIEIFNLITNNISKYVCKSDLKIIESVHVKIDRISDIYYLIEEDNFCIIELIFPMILIKTLQRKSQWKYTH